MDLKKAKAVVEAHRILGKVSATLRSHGYAVTTDLANSTVTGVINCEVYHNSDELTFVIDNLYYDDEYFSCKPFLKATAIREVCFSSASMYPDSTSSWSITSDDHDEDWILNEAIKVIKVLVPEKF